MSLQMPGHWSTHRPRIDIEHSVSCQFFCHHGEKVCVFGNKLKFVPWVWNIYASNYGVENKLLQQQQKGEKKGEIKYVFVKVHHD